MSQQVEILDTEMTETELQQKLKEYQEQHPDLVIKKDDEDDTGN